MDDQRLIATSFCIKRRDEANDGNAKHTVEIEMREHSPSENAKNDCK